MNDVKLVSVVMATYNGDKYLSLQLDSILRQTYKNIELIIVDDDSKDNTLSILYEYELIDSRIAIFRAESNLGFVKNFERGLLLAKGEFILLSDQDDIFIEDKINIMLDALEKNPECDLVVSDLTLIDENSKLIAQSMWRYQRLKPSQGKPFNRLVYSNFATGCAMMIRRRLLDFALPFPGNCVSHDWWLAIVAARKDSGGICLISQPLTLYRQHTLNVYGASKVVSIGLSSIFSRIFAKPRGGVIYKARLNIYMKELNRLNGYLEKNIWSPSELMVIEEARLLFSEYIDDRNMSIFFRLSKLKKRLSHAWVIGGGAFCMSVVLYTLSPYK